MINMNDDNQDVLALEDVRQQSIGRVGIIGATRMSVGIAMRLADAGVPVTLWERERASLAEAIALARSTYQEAVAQGRLAPHMRERRMALLAGTVNFHHLKDCDLVIDAAHTDTGARERLFHRLDQVTKPGAILMTRISQGVDSLARCTRRAGEVLGFHVPSPGSPGQAWELVPGTWTSRETLATLVALAGKLRQVVAVSGESRSR
jgi:3-hydroxyacyl-CoA dehydrogenase